MRVSGVQREQKIGYVRGFTWLHVPTRGPQFRYSSTVVSRPPCLPPTRGWGKRHYGGFVRHLEVRPKRGISHFYPHSTGQNSVIGLKLTAGNAGKYILLHASWEIKQIWWAHESVSATVLVTTYLFYPLLPYAEQNHHLPWETAPISIQSLHPAQTQGSLSNDQALHQVQMGFLKFL